MRSYTHAECRAHHLCTLSLTATTEYRVSEDLQIAGNTFFLVLSMYVFASVNFLHRSGCAHWASIALLRWHLWYGYRADIGTHGRTWGLGRLVCYAVGLLCS